MNIVYHLKAEDLSHLGGPMGTEYTTTKSLGLFKNLSSAILAAEKHYKPSQHYQKIKWKKDNKDWTSGDLGYIMYHIKKEKINE